MYLVYIDGYNDDYVDEITQSQAGNKGIGAVPHALVLVYDPQQGGVAHQTHHKHQHRNYGVDVLKMGLDRGGYEAHWRQERLFDDWRLIFRSLCVCVEAFSFPGAGGAVEAGRLEGGMDEHTRGRVLHRSGPVHLAHSSGCHADH